MASEKGLYSTTSRPIIHIGYYPKQIVRKFETYIYIYIYIYILMYKAVILNTWVQSGSFRQKSE